MSRDDAPYRYAPKATPGEPTAARQAWAVIEHRGIANDAREDLHRIRRRRRS